MILYFGKFLAGTGAGKGNRTLMASLEGWGFTIKLYPLLRENLPLRIWSAKAFFSKSEDPGDLPFPGK